MNNQDKRPPVPSNNNSLTKHQEKTPVYQTMAYKMSGVLSIIQLVHRTAQKTCRRVVQLLGHVTCCPAQIHPQPVEDARAQAICSPPSTILILNISNSTLIDCVIGSDSYQATVAESQPLMQKSGFQMHNQASCSCSHGQQGAAQTSPSPNIYIESSHLNCVIIGHNNSMHAEQNSWAEAEEMQE